MVKKEKTKVLLPAIILSIFMILVILGSGLLNYLYFENNCKNAIVNDNGEKNDVPLSYEIVSDYANDNPELVESLKIDNIVKRGYEIIEKDNFYYLIVSYGKAVSCCGKIGVTDVKVKENDLIIDVDFIDMCDCLYFNTTHPKAIIKLNTVPNSIKINFMER